MFVDITGYVTELNGENGFKIKVTSDRVYSRGFTDLQVSKEVSIYISPNRYPSDNSSEFKLITVEDKDQRDRINKFRYLSDTLSMGDRVNCTVFVVENYVINKCPKDIKTYAESDLWLCPYEECFKRVKVDSRESLKFRKQWFYTCRNKEKYEKITDSEWSDYRDKWWVNKNRIITFPILWWIQAKTAASNLWERLAGHVKDKPITINTIVTVIAIVVTVIAIIVAIR